jgi:hypothetical protein
MTTSGGVVIDAGVTAEFLTRDGALPDVNLAVDSLGFGACARTVLRARGAADGVGVTVTVRATVRARVR